MLSKFSTQYLAAAVPALLAGAICTFTGGQARAETVLSYSPWNPRSYVVNEAVYPWMDKVKEVTEGRVRIQPHAAAVGAPREQAEAVRDGLVDVSLVVPGYTPGRFPLLELGELPLLSDDSAVLAPAFAKVFNKHIAAHKPFKGAHVLSAFNVAPAHLTTSKSAVKNVNELKGRKLYISNRPTATVMRELGASPVSASIAEVFSMASTGVIDGAVFAYEPTITFGVAPYFKHFTTVKGGLGQAGMVLIVNEEKWNTIGEKDRAAIMAISGEHLAAQVGKAVAGGEKTSREKLASQGVTFDDMPAELHQALAAEVKKIDQAWVAKAKDAGLSNAEEVLKELRAQVSSGQ